MGVYRFGDRVIDPQKYPWGYQIKNPSLLGADLQAWWMSTAVTLDVDDTVLSWEDQSGNGKTLTPATVALRPTLIRGQLNGYPALRFVADELSRAATLGNSYLVYSVVKKTDQSTGVTYFSQGTSGAAGRTFLYGESSTNSWRCGIQVASTSSLLSGTPNSEYNLIGYQRNGADGKLYFNDVSQASVLSTNATQQTTFRVASQYGTSFSSIDLVELIIANPAISDIRRLAYIHNYLIHRYGLSV